MEEATRKKTVYRAAITRMQKRKQRLSVILMVAGSLGLLLALGLLATQLGGYRAARREYDALRAGFVSHAGAGGAEGAGPATLPATVDLGSLHALSPGCAGWLEIPGTGISYPVMQAADNDYYLNHTYSGEVNNAGSVFLDHRSAAAFTDQSTLLYGHNMRDGSMFGALSSYHNADWLAGHRTLYLHTENELLVYQVLAARRVEADDAVYALVGEGAGGAQGQALLDYWGTAAQGCTVADRFLTLSTCADAQSRDGRDVVLAVLVNTLPQ